jgi:cytochrome c oxidase assembly protein subunit 15
MRNPRNDPKDEILIDFLFGSSRIKFYAWASLVSQILIVVTGGAVRLTGSGLGCPTWPECQPGSITTVPALGIHGIIEFANRVLTFLLLVVAVLTFITVLRLKKNERPGLFWTSLALGLGIFVQAVIGGITVLTGLNSWIVGSHFIVSGILIAIASILLWHATGRKIQLVSKSFHALTRLTFPVGVLTVVIGVIVTGSGPHAGDAKTPRNGLDSYLLVHLHSYPAYTLLALVLLQIVLLSRKKQPLLVVLSLLGVIVSQAFIGLVQTWLGLPIGLVALHMLGASVLMSLLTSQLLFFKTGPKLR